MSQPFLALITPIGGGLADGRPEQPIYRPPGIWGPTDPRPGWGLPTPQPPVPGQPPYPSQGPGFPTNPIAPGGSPPGIWGGGNVPMPSPPIHIPPEQLPPGLVPDGKQVVVVWVPGVGYVSFLIEAGADVPVRPTPAPPVAGQLPSGPTGSGAQPKK